jgi:hypothetical protein
MKKTLFCLMLVVFLCSAAFATIYPCTTENIVGLKSFMTAIDNLSSIPDNMFSNIPDTLKGHAGTIQQGPFAGDTMSEGAGGIYDREYVQKDTSGNIVVTADYTTDGSKGIIYFTRPEYCRNKVNAPVAGVMDDATTMNLSWDYSNSPFRVFKVNIHGMVSANTPVHQWITVTKNGDTYQIASTMVFADTFSFPDSPSYNVGTVLFTAMVKDSDCKTMIYSDRAESATDSTIDDAASPTTGPWPTPFYIDANNPSPNLTEPSAWGGSPKFSSSDKTDTQGLPLKSHNQVKAGEL